MTGGTDAKQVGIFTSTHDSRATNSLSKIASPQVIDLAVDLDCPLSASNQTLFLSYVLRPLSHSKQPKKQKGNETKKGQRPGPYAKHTEDTPLIYLNSIFLQARASFLT